MVRALALVAFAVAVVAVGAFAIQADDKPQPKGIIMLRFPFSAG